MSAGVRKSERNWKKADIERVRRIRIPTPKRACSVCGRLANMYGVSDGTCSSACRERLRSQLIKR